MRCAILVVTLVLCACPRRPAPPPPPAPVKKADAPPVEMLTRAAKRVSSRQRLSAVAQVTGVPGLGGLNIHADLVVERPAKMYVGVRGFFGPPSDEVWTDGRVFLWRSMRPGAGAKGPATPQAIGALLPVPLPPAQWVGLLLGLPLPPDDPASVDTCAACTEGMCTCLRLAWTDGRQLELTLDGEARAAEARLRAYGTQYTVRYTKPDGPDGMCTDLWIAEGDRSARVQLSDVTLNGAPPPASLFAPLSEVAPASLLLPGAARP